MGSSSSLNVDGEDLNNAMSTTINQMYILIQVAKDLKLAGTHRPKLWVADPVK